MTDTSSEALRKMADKLEDTTNPYWDQKRAASAMDEAAALLRAIAAEREWRTMDSAPRDGTRCLLKTLGGKISIGWQNHEGGAIFAVENLGSKLSKPAFWQPLPTGES